MNNPVFTTQCVSSICDVDAKSWNELFSCDGELGYPFIQHGFLKTLELTGCTTLKTGWKPCHLLVKNSDDELVAAMVLYEKTHSYGEYVFDWSWADAYHHSGLEYYPKLVSAIPFTPATGPRLGLKSGLSSTLTEKIVCEIEKCIRTLGESKNISSAHILFPSAANLCELNSKDESMWLHREGCQFHWFNNDFNDFSVFLASFSSRKRKNIKKERAKIASEDITLTIEHARDIDSKMWAKFYSLYHHTYLKRSGRYGYLTAEFFQSLTDVLPDQVIMCQATKAGELIAAALYFKDKKTLYGRYWGALEEIDGLHFEACYYQGIEYAIGHGLQRFDPGAQGEHKIQRGFVPVKTASLHWIKEPAFNKGIAEFLRQESFQIDAYVNDGRTYLPFKEGEELPAPDILMKKR